jgi:hypothetical protein
MKLSIYICIVPTGATEANLWEKVQRTPHLWHFAVHSIPELPEKLVQGHQGKYFGYFYAASADPSKITAEVRAVYARAYATDSALTAGFQLVPTFPLDAAANKEAASQAPAVSRWSGRSARRCIGQHRTPPVRCGFALECSVGVLLHRAALGMP